LRRGLERGCEAGLGNAGGLAKSGAFCRGRELRLLLQHCVDVREHSSHAQVEVEFVLLVQQ
jgi:hypothetical protein